MLRLGQIVLYSPGVRRNPRPAIVSHIYDLESRQVALSVCWAPRDGVRSLPDVVGYSAPRDGSPESEHFCFLADVLTVEDDPIDVSPDGEVTRRGRRRRG